MILMFRIENLSVAISFGMKYTKQKRPKVPKA